MWLSVMCAHIHAMAGPDVHSIIPILLIHSLIAVSECSIEIPINQLFPLLVGIVAARFLEIV